jgi:hypothetical protein
MNYLLAIIFAVGGITILIRNNSLSEKLEAFYARRYSANFGKLAHLLRLDDPNTRLNRFMYRRFIITAGLILLIFALAALSGTNFAGPPAQPDNSSLQAQ